MQNSAPKTQPQNDGVKARLQDELQNNSQNEWIAAFVQSGAWRAKKRSLPLLWLLIVSAFVFPMGLWSSLDVAGQADEIESKDSSASRTPAVPDTTKSSAKADEVFGNELSTLPDAPVDRAPSKRHPVEVRPNVKVVEATIAPSGTKRIRVQVIVSGQKRSGQVLLRRGASVREAVEAMNLKIGKQDHVIPAASTRVYDGAKIRITRIRSVLKTRSISIEPEVRYQLTTDLSPGATKTVQSGQSGVIQLSERVWFKDGAVSGRENLGQKIVRAAKDEIVATGARARYMPGRIPYHNRYARAYTNASRSGSPRDRIQSNQTKTLRRVSCITLVATGYSPDPSENGGYTTTATGLPIGYGAAAVDPRVVPLGTKMYIEGYGYAFACDTGGAIKGHRIDLAYDSYGVANSKGHKTVRAWILAP